MWIGVFFIFFSLIKLDFILGSREAACGVVFRPIITCCNNSFPPVI